jgi:transcriptional regulator with XRE-family HTH domain
VSGSRAAIAERLAELRRRHFGPRGKSDFAARLGVDLADYERYERGAMPPADVLLRACELTGEDLQWLLTGVAARGTVVISGARARHQEVLGRVAQLLERRPEAARQIEAFLGLLEHAPTLPAPDTNHPANESPWIPLYAPGDAPRALPATAGREPVALPPPTGAALEERPAALEDVGADFAALAEVRAAVCTLRGPVASAQRWLRAPGLGEFVPQLFAVELDDERLSPMLSRGDAAVVSASIPAEVGRPALCRVLNEETPRAGVWLGEEGGRMHLGRTDTHDRESIPPEDIQWSLKILLRVKWAA